MDIMNESLELHRKLKGKITTKTTYPVKDMHDMSLVYTPGVAAACQAIADDPAQSYELTAKRRTVAVISDGTSVLGLGDIGPRAAMPVMEGKCAIFKRFAGLDAIPIVLDTKDVDELVETIYRMSPSFGGINLEDISAPRCFEVERRLKEMCDIPVFHDDQHGTAIVAGAALKNALRLVKKELSDVRIVVNGAGSAGTAITRFLLSLGARDITVCDRKGVIASDDLGLNASQRELAAVTNPKGRTGTLEDALRGADVFIGVSAGNIVTERMIQGMNADPIVFPLANPVPEISRDKALSAGARVVGTGVSNLPNQINNALAFPGLFKGALESGVRDITMEMQIAASEAIASIVTDETLSETYIIPNIFDRRVASRVAASVRKAARTT
jgi:malate dehydrogenase (oxaloacetate-decarboxylating)